MNTNHGMKKILVRLIELTLRLCLLVAVGYEVGKAQVVAEHAATTSVSGAVSSQANVVVWPPKTLPENQGASPHLRAPSGPPPEVRNRQALEQQAGKDACKLLLRSTPTAAQVWIDGAFVGNTPMLILVPPGKYQIHMRGPRLESSKQVVALLPRETQEIVLTLAVRYPLRVTVH